MGTFFCLASFLTYTLLGFGLLRVIHSSSLFFPFIRTAVEVLMLCLVRVHALFTASKTSYWESYWLEKCACQWVKHPGSLGASGDRYCEVQRHLLGFLFQQGGQRYEEMGCFGRWTSGAVQD